MNWKRVFLFVVYLFIFTALAAFPFGFIDGFSRASGVATPVWVPLGQALSVPIACLLVFARLSYVQPEKDAVNSGMVALVSWLITFPINVILLHQSAGQWAAGFLVILVALVLGLLLGRFCRRRKGLERQDQAAS